VGQPPGRHPIRGLGLVESHAALLSQAELARRAGVSAQTVIRLERGEPAELVTARKLAAALVEPRELARPPGDG
jgi:transcriptional regulator with XRE-family HTH domain